MKILFLFLILFAVVKTHKVEYARFDETENEEKHWIVYDAESFEQNQLCNVLHCKMTEFCIVRNGNAICVDPSKIHEIDGLKLHYRTGLDVETGKTKKIPKHLFYGPEVRPQKQKPPRHNVVTSDCSEKELTQIGDRLKTWFSDAHALEKNENSKPLPKHKVFCAEDVSWMFSQWDVDLDGELDVNELKNLEDVGTEKCIRPFLDRCDTNRNNGISLDEWCDCFLWIGKDEEEPACHAAKHRMDPHLIGSFHPRCDLDGFYKPLQCQENSCWCVDKWGREFEGSRMEGARADCGQYEIEDDDDDSDDLANEHYQMYKHK